MANLGQAYVQIVPSAEGLAGSITKALGGEADSAGKGAGLKIVGAIKKLIIGAGLGTALKAALDEGAKLQQSYGGLETLYGDAAGAAKEYAAAAAAAGISANSYAEQAVSFGASLKQAFGGDTTKSVEAANTAILDMADNAAKMGTPLESIQNAYQGFAKQNYTMLDNLKLGYGGTKTEMERLLADAQKITGVEYDIDNLGDVYEAIHVIQGELGLTGVAAEEAASTFSGSLGAMKAAGQNVLGNLALGEDIRPSLQALGTATSNFIKKNLLPMVGNVLKGVPDIISGVIDEAIGFIHYGLNNLDQIILPEGLALVQSFADAILGALPALAEVAIRLVSVLGKSIMSQDWLSVGMGLITSLKDSLVATAETVFGTSDPGQIMQMIAKGLTNALPKILDMGQNIITTLTSGISSMSDRLPDVLVSIANTAINLLKSVDWIGLGVQVINFIGNGMVSVTNMLAHVLDNIGKAGWQLFKSIDWLGLGRQVIQFIINGITAIDSTLRNNFKKVGQNALNAFKNISWVQLGRDVINGVVKGVSNAAGSLYNSLKNIAKNALQSAKDFLKIGSPSKLFAEEVGQWIPPGIAEGAEQAAGVLDDAMRDIALDALGAVDGFTIGQAAAPASPPSSGAVIYNTFNISAPAGMDVRELADQVVMRMTMAERQRAAVWGTA